MCDFQKPFKYFKRAHPSLLCVTDNFITIHILSLPKILSILYQAALLKFSSNISHPFHQTLLGTFCFNIRLFPNESFNTSRNSVVFHWKHPCSMKGTIQVASTKKSFTLHNQRCSDEDAEDVVRGRTISGHFLHCTVLWQFQQGRRLFSTVF